MRLGLLLGIFFFAEMVIAQPRDTIHLEFEPWQTYTGPIRAQDKVVRISNRLVNNGETLMSLPVPIYLNFAVILDTASFPGIDFQKASEFKNCRFERFADFSSVKFRENALFDSANFATGCRFIFDTFSNDAFFWDVRFHHLTDFQSSSFSRSVSFIGAAFYGDVQFSGVNFLQKSSFYMVHFQGNVDFNNTVFRNDVDFIMTTFDHALSFSGAKFKDSSKVEFFEAVLPDTIDFTDVKSNQEIDLTNANYYPLRAKNKDSVIHIFIENCDIGKLKLDYRYF